MYSLDDTIAAISTPVGEGGIGIVRMSGTQALEIVRQLFRPGPGLHSLAVNEASPSEQSGLPASSLTPSPSPRGRGESCLTPYHLHYGHILEPDGSEVVDEVLAAYMPAPRTYTRQDVVEINAHGGIVALRRILGLCLRLGARLAEPGEFTVRAFLNGRLDLAQAEAVLDIVRARTEKSLSVAVDQLAGRLSEQVKSIRALLVDLLLYLEASIDFAEDEIPEREVGLDLQEAGSRLAHLLAEADQGIVYRQGVRTAIVGRPNVGKSSLLNRLLRTSRAIVTDIPGTTRDTLEETLNLQGVPFVLVDTAGISAGAQNPIEQLSIERSRAALSQADLAVMVVDASQPLAEADQTIAALIGDKPTVVALNKIDLVDVDGSSADGSLLPGSPCVAISALTGQGLERLEATMLDRAFSGQVTGSAPAVTNPRHKAALEAALHHVRAACMVHKDGLSADLVAIDVAAAVRALGEITGQTASEDLLESIFGHFCVGK